MLPDTKQAGPLAKDRPTTNHNDTLTVADASDNWPDRLADLMAQYRAKRAVAAAERTERGEVAI